MSWSDALPLVDMFFWTVYQVGLFTLLWFTNLLANFIANKEPTL